jgi:Beta-galactosidase, domain 3
VLFLYGHATQEHEMAFAFKGVPRIQVRSAHVQFVSTSDFTIVNILPGLQGLITIWDSDEQLILFSDTDTTQTFWSPIIPADASQPFANYFQIGTNNSILVGGPYFVRSANISGSELALKGDLNTGVRLIVIAPSSIRSITWNGEEVASDISAASELSSQGCFIGYLRTRQLLTGINVPSLKGWKYADSLPEIAQDFSDDYWIMANHTTSNIPYPPYYGDGRILYGCDYGL